MAGETVIYQERVIPKDGFRAFVYGLDNKQKLVESWEDYMEAVSSGLWFSKKEQVPEKSKKQRGE